MAMDPGHDPCGSAIAPRAPSNVQPELSPPSLQCHSFDRFPSSPSITTSHSCQRAPRFERRRGKASNPNTYAFDATRGSLCGIAWMSPIIQGTPDPYLMKGPLPTPTTVSFTSHLPVVSNRPPPSTSSRSGWSTYPPYRPWALPSATTTTVNHEGAPVPMPAPDCLL